MIANKDQDLITSTISSDGISSVIVIDGEAEGGLIFEVNGTGEFSVRFEMSSNGTDFYAINELDSFTSDAVQSLAASINLFRFVRAKIDIGSSGSVTLIKVHSRKE